MASMARGDAASMACGGAEEEQEAARPPWPAEIDEAVARAEEDEAAARKKSRWRRGLHSPRRKRRRRRGLHGPRRAQRKRRRRRGLRGWHRGGGGEGGRGASMAGSAASVDGVAAEEARRPQWPTAGRRSGQRPGFTKPAGTGPVTAVTGLTGPDRFRFRPVLNRPKFKF